MQTVIFPLIGLKMHINRIAFNLFGKNIYWYGIILCTAFIAATMISLRLTKHSHISEEELIDLLIIIVPIGIIGARLYYVLFKFNYYINNPAEIIAIWNGGLAIYGGIIAAFITLVVYCKIKKRNLLMVLDIFAVGLPLAQSIGRWGNFFNVEAYGYRTSVPWRMEIYSLSSNKLIGVHPTFLYESIGSFIIFIILFRCFKSKKYDGIVTAMYFILYGFLRFFIEGLRSDSLYFFNIRISQFVSVLLIFTGLIYILFRKFFREKA